jgi:hypothetical protein
MSKFDTFKKGVESFGDDAAPELKQAAQGYEKAAEGANKALNEKQAAEWAKRFG